MNSKDLADWIVRPTLAELADAEPRLDSPAAVELLIGTWAQESDGGRWIDQTTPGPGPAYGPFQMERATHDWIWEWLLRRPGKLKTILRDLSIGIIDDVHELHGNFYYATAMARVYYWMAPAPLPSYGDVLGYAQYWKRFWNTERGKGTVEQFMARWDRYVKGRI